jgi:hypothetical protein
MLHRRLWSYRNAEFGGQGGEGRARAYVWAAVVSTDESKFPYQVQFAVSARVTARRSTIWD